MVRRERGEVRRARWIIQMEAADQAGVSQTAWGLCETGARLSVGLYRTALIGWLGGDG